MMTHEMEAKLYKAHLVQQLVVVKLFKAQHREAKLFKVVLRVHKEVAMLYKDPQVMQMVMNLSKAQHREAKLFKVVLRTHREVATMYKDPQAMQMVMKLSKVQHRVQRQQVHQKVLQ